MEPFWRKIEKVQFKKWILDIDEQGPSWHSHTLLLEAISSGIWKPFEVMATSHLQNKIVTQRDLKFVNFKIKSINFLN